MSEITYEQLFDILRREKARDELQAIERDFYSDVKWFLQRKQDNIAAESANGANTLAAQRATIEYQNVRKLIKELYERREKKIITMAQHKTRAEGAVIDQTALLAQEKDLFEELVEVLQRVRDNVTSGFESRLTAGYTSSVERGQEDASGSEPAVDKNDHLSEGTESDAPFDSDASKTQSRSQDEENENAISDENSAASAAARVAIARNNVVRNDVAAGDTFVTVLENIVKVRFLSSVPKFLGKDRQIFGPFQQDEETKLPPEIAEILVKKGRAQIL